MYMRLVELEFSVGFLASELRTRIESDLVPALSAEPGFLKYYVVETQDNRLATVRVFDDLDALEAAHQAVHDIEDVLVQEFGINPGITFEGEVTAEA